MLIKSDWNTITISFEVARALVEFAGDDLTRPQLAIGVDPKGVLAATDGVSAIRFTLAPIHGGLTGRCWSRDHVAQELKIAKARKADAIVLHREQALEATLTFPPLDQVVPERGVGPDVCVAGDLLARIELAVYAVHGVPKRHTRAPFGAHLVSARSPLDAMLWWVVTKDCTEVAVQVIVMPVNTPLAGRLSCAEAIEGADERPSYAA